MATAAELLAARMSGVSDDKTLIIDNYLREIQIPSSVTTLGVENDDDVLRLRFRMPRYLDTTDLSTFSIRINYLNAQGESDVYTVSDAEVVGDYLTFSWLVGPTATRYKGKTKFNVCMRIVNAEFVVQKEYNTAIATLPVLEGLECEESAIEAYSDVLEQWKTQLFGMGDTLEAKLEAKSEEEQQKIVDKGIEVLETIPEDFTTTHNLANEALRTRANAIVQEVSGEVAVLDNCSDDYLRDLRVFGYGKQTRTTGTQLFNPYALQNTSFGTATVEENGAKITVTGEYYVSWPLVLKAGVTYFIDFTTTGDVEYRAVRFEYPDKEITGTITNPASFTPAKDTVSVYLYASLGSGGTVTYENLQISEGNSAKPWEPYSGGVASPSVEWPQEISGADITSIAVYGGNLAYFGDVLKTPKTTTGVTFTLKKDGRIELTGTPSKVADDILDTIHAAKITRPALLTGVRYRCSDCSMEVEYAGSDLIKTWTRDIVITDDVISINAYIQPRTMHYTNGQSFSPKMWIEPYEPTEYYSGAVSQGIAAHSTTPLYGIKVESGGNYTDSNGDHWICDEIDYGSGTLIRRTGVEVFDGSSDENWQTDLELENTVMFRIFIPLSVNVGNVVGKDYTCSHLPILNMYNADIIGTQHTMQQFYFRVRKDSLSTPDLAGFRAMLAEKPMTVCYALMSSSVEFMTDEERHAFSKLRGNYPMTVVANDANAPMEISYNADTKIYMDASIWEHAMTPSDEQIQAAVDAWLTRYFTSAEGVKF